MLKLFFADYVADKVVEAANAQVATKEEILQSMDCVLRQPQNFLGVTDKEGRTLQFMVNDDGTIRVELPSPAERGSFVKDTDLSDTRDIIQGIDEAISAAEIRGLTFEQW